MTQVTGYIPRWFTCPRTVTHPSSNPALHGRKSNSQPVDYKSDTLTTACLIDFELCNMYNYVLCSLYTPHGVKVQYPSQLVNGAVYVAVGSELGGHFQYRDYGLNKVQLDRGRKRYPFQWRKKSERCCILLPCICFIS